MGTLFTISNTRKYEAHIMNMYHNSLLAIHQGPYKTFLIIWKQFHFPNMLPKLQRYIESMYSMSKIKTKKKRSQTILQMNPNRLYSLQKPSS